MDFGAGEGREDTPIRLTSLAPDPEWAEHVRRRCRARMARRKRIAVHAEPSSASLQRRLGTAFIGAVSVLYAGAVLAAMVRLEALLFPG